jgi:hypothetical protein
VTEVYIVSGVHRTLTKEAFAEEYAWLAGPYKKIQEVNLLYKSSNEHLNDEQIMGTEYTPDDDGKYYNSLTDEEKAEDQKALKNKGYYRGPRGGFHTNGDTKFEWVGKAQTYRRVLCQAYFDNTKDHYLRIRCASKSKTGNNNEFMMDYLELVPKSVYGVANSGEIEDDL